MQYDLKVLSLGFLHNYVERQTTFSSYLQRHGLIRNLARQLVLFTNQEEIANILVGKNINSSSSFHS